jgi:uncharacterized protein involved in exopolysaccharide biosynthesis
VGTIAWITSIPTALSAAWCAYQSPRFEARTTIEFEPALLPGDAAHRGLQEYLETQMVIVTSQTVCAKAMSLVYSIRRGSTFLRERSREICDGLHVSRIGHSSVIELRYLDPDPEWAKSFVSAMADAYFLRVQAVHQETRDAFRDWGSELRQIDVQLDGDQLALARFSKEHSIGSMESERALVDASLRSYTQALVDARVKRIETTSRLSGLEAAHDAGQLSSFRGNDPDFDRLRQRTQVLEEERQALALATDGKHVKLPAIEAELERVRGQARAAAGAILRAMRMQAEAAKRQEAELQRALEQTRREAIRLLDLDAELGRLNRSTQARESMRNVLLTKMGSATQKLDDARLAGRILSRAHIVGQRSLRPLAILLCAIWLSGVLWLALRQRADGIPKARA